MSRLLLAWELGGGAGHLQMVGALIAPLRARGHEVALAVRDLPGAQRLLGHLDVPMVQAPVWVDAAPLPTPAVSYGEVLLLNGYRDPARVAALARGWQALYRLLGCDAVVAEHGPTALIAARAAGMPRAAMGTGFFVPPPETPLPSLQPWADIPRDRLAEAEAGALARVNEALEALRGPALARLWDLFEGTGPYLTTFPELDHYGPRGSVRYWGPLMATAGGVPPDWPEGDGERVFVYLHPHYPQFQGLVQQLSRLGWPTLVVAPGLDPGQARRLAGPSLRLVSGPVDLGAVARDCRVVFTHAAHGTVAECLRRGLAPIMIPAYVEQVLLGWRLARQGLGLVAHPDPRAHDYGDMARRLLGAAPVAAKTAAFAARYRDYDHAAAAAALADRLLADLEGAG